MQNILQKIPLTKKQLLLIAAAILCYLIYHMVTTVFFKPPVVKTIPYVRTVTIGVTDQSSQSSYPGEVRGRYESTLAFQTAGKIVSRNVSLGDTVKAGQILLRIDPKDVAQSVLASNAAVSAAEANYKLASDNAERYSLLYASGAVSKAMLDQFNTQLEAAASALQQARAKQQADSNMLSYTELVADHDGVVTALYAEIGQVVAAGTPIATVVQNDEKEIRIYVPESKLQSIHPGDPAKIEFWALNGINVTGKVREISQMSDSITRTYQVSVLLDSVPAEVKLGMTAKVFFNNGSSELITLPKGAIYQTENVPQVWVVRDRKVQLTTVTLDGYEDNNVRIKSGLQNGDVVVIGGANKLAPNQEVRLEGEAS